MELQKNSNRERGSIISKVWRDFQGSSNGVSVECVSLSLEIQGFCSSGQTNVQGRLWLEGGLKFSHCNIGSGRHWVSPQILCCGCPGVSQWNVGHGNVGVIVE